MIKKLMLMFSLVIFAACVPQSMIKHEAQDPIIVKLQVEGVDNVKISPDKVNRTMEVKNERGELSNLTFIENNTAYIKIFGNLGGYDSTNLWNDFCILTMRGIKHIELYINTGGGSAFSGLSLADQINRIKNKGVVINAHASGIIASAAVPVYSVCSTRFAAPGTLFMVHEATLFKMFANETKSDIKAQNVLMELLENKYLKILSDSSKLSATEWRKKASEITWFSAETAKKWGLVDIIE